MVWFSLPPDNNCFTTDMGQIIRYLQSQKSLHIYNDAFYAWLTRLRRVSQ